MQDEAFTSDFVLGRGGHSANILAPEDCLDLGSGKGGAVRWARESVAGDIL